MKKCLNILGHWLKLILISFLEGINEGIDLLNPGSIQNFFKNMGSFLSFTFIILLSAVVAFALGVCCVYIVCCLFT